MPKFYDTIACTWGDGVPSGSKYLGARATRLRCPTSDGSEEMDLKLLHELPNAGSYGFAFECEHTGGGRAVYCAKFYKCEPREETNELTRKKSRDARDAHYTWNELKALRQIISAVQHEVRDGTGTPRQHPNIARVELCGTNGVLTIDGNEYTDVAYSLHEYCANGDLLSYVAI